MKRDIPDWLIEMSRQMNSNPDRCTAHPFWQVRNKEYIPTAEGCNEHHWEIIDTDDCGFRVYRSDKDKDFTVIAEHLIDGERDWCKEWFEIESDHDVFSEELFVDSFNEVFEPDYHDLPDGYKRVYLQEVEEVVTTHLTQDDAEWFIERKKHDYPNAYTYVESAYWSPQLKQLQDWIKSLGSSK